MKKSFLKISFIAFIGISIANGADVSLSKAYEMALENDKIVKSTMYENLAAKERTWQATATLLPSIEATYVYNGEKYNKQYPGTKDKMDETYQRYGVTLNQQVFRPDLWYGRAQDSLREDGYDLIYEQAKQDLANRVAMAYFELAYANKSLELAAILENTNRLKFDQLSKRLELGLANKMDTLEANVRYDQALLGVSRAQRRIEVAKLALAKLTGQEIGTYDDFENLQLDFFESVDTSKYENVFANHEYQQSQIASKIAIYEKNKRIAAFLPTADFSLSYSNYDYKEKVRFGDEKNKVETMFRVSMPIFKSGLTYARMQEGEYLKMSSLTKELDTQRKVEIDQKTAVSDFRNYLSEAKIMRNSVQTAKLYQISVERGYNEGLRDVIALFDARARVHQTMLDSLEASHKLVLAYIKLEYLIGAISPQTIQNLQSVFVKK